MLKLIWTPGGAAAPDTNAYKRATDTLTASYADSTAKALFPRDAPPAADALDGVAGVLRDWLGNRTVTNAAVKLMLHGYDYDPRHVGDPSADPFMLVYAYPGNGGPDPRLSWLPLVEECDATGGRRQETAIAFAWVSTGSLAEYAPAGWSETYEYACVDLAPLAAKALAAVLRAAGDEDVTVDVFAHSLGTRLFTQAVAALGPDDGMLGDVILLDGAEFAVDAAATFAGRRFNVINITNEIDAVLTLGAEQLGDPSRVPRSVTACSLGRYGLGSPESWTGFAEYPPNWVDIAFGSARRSGLVQGERGLHTDAQCERCGALKRAPEPLGLLHRGGQSCLADRSVVEAGAERRGVCQNARPANWGSWGSPADLCGGSASRKPHQ